MALFQRMPPGTAASEATAHSVLGMEGGLLAAIVSSVALLFSRFSLWETSLKVAEIKVYVTDTYSYTRDPWGLEWLTFL